MNIYLVRHLVPCGFDTVAHIVGAFSSESDAAAYAGKRNPTDAFESPDYDYVAFKVDELKDA